MFEALNANEKIYRSPWFNPNISDRRLKRGNRRAGTENKKKIKGVGKKEERNCGKGAGGKEKKGTGKRE